MQLHKLSKCHDYAERRINRSTDANLDIIALVDEYVDLDDEEKEESGDGNDNNGDETKTEMEQLYTELIQLKGSSFHATFQNNLKQYKERLIEKQSVMSSTLRTSKRQRQECYCRSCKFVYRR